MFFCIFDFAYIHYSKVYIKLYLRRKNRQFIKIGFVMKNVDLQ